MIDLCNKKQMSDNVIKKEENAFEDLELYYIDESDKLQNSIHLIFAIFIFCFFVTRSGFCCEDRLATLPLGLVAPTLLDACLPISNLLATRTQWKIDEMVMNRLSTFPALRNSRRQKVYDNKEVQTKNESKLLNI